MLGNRGGVLITFEIFLEFFFLFQSRGLIFFPLKLDHLLNLNNFKK